VRKEKEREREGEEGRGGGEGRGERGGVVEDVERDDHIRWSKISP
jgi:hypothetical protein